MDHMLDTVTIIRAKCDGCDRKVEFEVNGNDSSEEVRTIALQFITAAGWIVHESLGLRCPSCVPVISSDDWGRAEDHFCKVRDQYLDLQGTPGVNVAFALQHIFEPLQVRYDRGERTRDLFDKMMAVE